MQQCKTVFASTQSNHDSITILDHVELFDCTADQVQYRARDLQEFYFNGLACDYIVIIKVREC